TETRPGDSAAPPNSAGPTIPGSPLRQKVKTYTFVQLSRQGTPEQFYRASHHALEKLLLELVNYEAPIHLNAAARRIAAAWGITRIGANVQNQVNGIAAQLAAKGLIQIQDNFLWSVEDSPIVVR